MTDTVRVEYTRSASRQIQEASDWWRANRQAAPDLFAHELERVIRLISARPEIGASATDTRLQSVRRVHLSRVRYHLYYRLDRKGARLEVLALWHMSRGTLPPVPRSR